ncbi:hypothetical protein MTR_8g467700 [Medicago truncatula]|uniref:Epidermal patterning factor-like protein n=1 Tax=Medicago truncatula TaxID=3880 RepID=A0A072TQR4_MEDTR|nr:hypothetical protein MTR_8g467700 [Medicago truncatula]
MISVGTIFFGIITSSTQINCDIHKEIGFPTLSSYEELQHAKETVSQIKSEKPNVMSRRLLSTPPDCKDRCENCSPCKPILVSIPPLQDPIYKSEGWLCICNNKCYTPNP